MSEHVAGDSLAWQTHLPDTMAELRNTRRLACHWQTHLPDATSLHTGAVPKRSTGGIYVEKPSETLRLASASYSHLVRGPNILRTRSEELELLSC